MAAGRHYKNYSHDYKEGSHHPRNGYYPKSYIQFHDLSGTERHNDRSHSHRRKDEYRDNRQPGYSFYEEDGAHRVSEKKRKISPVVRDTRYEKQVRVPSTNGISLPALPRTLKFPDFVIDARIRLHPVELRAMLTGLDGVGVPKSLTDCNAATSRELLGDNDEEMGQIEEGEYAVENNILKSKGVDLYDPLRTVPETKLSSLRVGQFFGEGHEENGDISPVAVEDGHFMGLDSQGKQLENELSSDTVSVISDEESPGVSPGELTSEDDDDCSEAYEGRRYGILPGSRGVFEYERLKRISEGTFGIVFKARDKKTGEIVALKKVKIGNKSEGFPVTALREINILTSLKHPSIVEVKEVATDDFDGVFIVMEYVDYELKGFMESMKHPFSQSEVKCLMKQLLEGLSYLHDNWVLHRDLKTSNLLLNKNGEMKICDFGMARQYGSPSKPYTPLVVTLWYRAPEILLGAKQYSTAIDMWSVGCIMAELLAKKPLFDGSKELEQLQKIFKTLGTPDEKIWRGYSSLPGAKFNVVKQPYNNLRKMFPAASFNGGPVLTELGFDLLVKLLTYDPEKRITARAALSHPWFAEFPLPVERISTFR